MRLTVVNLSKTLQHAEFHAAIAAIAKQVDEDFAPEWNVSAIVRGTTAKIGANEAPIQGRHGAIIYVGDSSQDPTTGVENALGYHFVNHKDVPYGFVYLDICEAYGQAWSWTLSHEVLELLADPDAVLTVSGPDPDDHHRHVNFDLEVCDPTQSDSYSIDGVAVSNFVTRAWFGMTGGTNKTNFLELELAPFGVRPGGYAQYEDGNEVIDIQGDLAPEIANRRRAARGNMKKGRRNTRRADRLETALAKTV